MINKKVGLFVVVLCLSSCLLGATFVYGIVSQSHVISGGVYSGAPDYTVWTDDDGLYFAKSAYGALTWNADLGDLVNGLLADRVSVMFTGGNYLELETTIDTNGYADLEFYGTRGTSIRMASGADLAVMFWVNASTSCHIHDLRILGANDVNTDGTLIDATGDCSWLVVEGCEVADGYCGIEVDYPSTNVVIANNLVLNMYEEGIFAVNRGTASLFYGGYVIEGNTIVDTGFHGICVTGVSNTVISGNTIRLAGANWLDGFGHGIAYDGNSGDNPVVGGVVSGNSIYDSRMCGIEAADSCDGITITGNYVEDSGWSGIYVGGFLADSNCTVVSGNSVFNNDRDGVRVENVTNFVVSGNCIEQTGWSGVYVVTSGKGSVAGNSIAYVDGTGGLYFDASVGVDVSGNVVSSPNGAYGVFFNNTDNSMVTGNSVYDGAGWGFLIDGASVGVCLVGNWASGCDTGGMSTHALTNIGHNYNNSAWVP